MTDRQKRNEVSGHDVSINIIDLAYEKVPKLTVLSDVENI